MDYIFFIHYCVDGCFPVLVVVNRVGLLAVRELLTGVALLAEHRLRVQGFGSWRTGLAALSIWNLPGAGVKLVPRIGRWSLTYRTTREVQSISSGFRYMRAR